MENLSLTHSLSSVKQQWQDILRMAIRILLGGVMLWAGIVKLANPDGFIRSLMVYQLFPPAWSGIAIGVIAGLLPWCEIMFGLACIVGYKIRIVSWALAVLLSIFTVILGVTLWRGIDIVCGCFGSQNDPITLWNFLRNGLFIAGALWLAYSPRHRWTTDDIMRVFFHI